MPDDSNIAPEDRLLYQYLFTREFVTDVWSRIVQSPLYDHSRRSGGYVVSAALRHAALLVAGHRLGFETVKRNHRTALIREVFRRGNISDFKESFSPG